MGSLTLIFSFRSAYHWGQHHYGCCPNLLPTIEENLSMVLALASVSFRRRAIFWTQREVDPIGGAALLEDQFIEIALGTIRDVEQDASHADHLLRAITLDIHRTTSEMIRTLSPSTFVSWNIKSSGKRLVLRLTCSLRRLVVTPYSIAKSESSITF